MKSYQARQIASYFIKKADLNTENDLTNLKLQKILYFAQAEFYRKFGEALFTDPIEAWEYGPVVYDVYKWLSGCGGYRISSFDVNLEDDNFPENINSFLDSIWEKYSMYSASYLVTKTHTPSEPWDKAYNNRPNTKIELKDLKEVKLHDEW